MSKVYDAMTTAIDAHGDQKRKYTGDPYWKHLAEVAAIVNTVTDDEDVIAAAWLHDTLEDTELTRSAIREQFGERVLSLVIGLTEVDVSGNRKVRKEAERARLASQGGDVQTIKYADLISNTSSIVNNDPGFARVYLDEKVQLLQSMTDGNEMLWCMALRIYSDALQALGR